MSAITDDFEELGLPDYIEVVANRDSPRLIKTHLSFDMIPSQIIGKNAKVGEKSTSLVLFEKFIKNFCNYCEMSEIKVNECKFTYNSTSYQLMHTHAEFCIIIQVLTHLDSAL